MRRDRLSPAIAEAARSHRRLQRTLQRHPTMQGSMLLRAYKWSNAWVMRFRSAVGTTGLKMAVPSFGFQGKEPQTMVRKIGKTTLFATIVATVLLAGTVSARQLRTGVKAFPGACGTTCNATVHCGGLCTCWIDSG